MKRHLALFGAAVALAAIPIASASACSVVDDYRVPSNLELVGSAELIMLGRVVGQKQAGEFDWEILVEPISAIKGVLPPSPIVLDRMLLAEGEFEHYGVLSNPYELADAHPTSYVGSCVRSFFPQGTVALFFLERQEDGEWSSSGGPFTRWAEDVLSDDAPWLLLTRFYNLVSSAPAETQKVLLENERDRLTALNGPVARLMAADVARQLEAPNRPWNEIMERAISGEEEISPAMSAEATAQVMSEMLMESEDTLGEVEVEIGEDGYSLEATVSLDPEMTEDEAE